MNYLIIPAIVAIVVCAISYLMRDKREENKQNYFVTFILTFCAVAIVAYVFSSDGMGQAKGGSLKTVMREINIGDPDF